MKNVQKAEKRLFNPISITCRYNCVLYVQRHVSQLIAYTHIIY